MAKGEGSSLGTIGMLVIGAVVVAAVFGRDDVETPGPVLIVGDSLLYSAADELHNALRDDGWQARVEAQPGAGIAGGGYGDVYWPDWITLATAQQRYTVAIIELGTNGCDGCASLDAAIDDVMRPLEHVDKVLWLDVRSEAPRPTDAAAINDALRRAPTRWPNLEVLEFDDWLDNEPGMITDDGVHLTPAGQLTFTQHVRDELRDRSNAGDPPEGTDDPAR
jgi:lysophospholipase L1-like esterase